MTDRPLPNSGQSSSAATARDTSTVYLFDPIGATPTYHDYGGIKQLDIARQGDVTKCGMVIYDGADQTSARLRRDHADLFGKPCRRCFRDA